MEIIKTFFDKNLVQIKGTDIDPLFRAKDIALILGINNFRESIKNYDDDEKVLIDCLTNGGVQKTIFLTEIGLYRFIFRSNKEIAKQFNKWICKVIKDIRNDNNRLETEIDEQKKIIDDKDFELIIKKDLLLKDLYRQVQCVYIALIKLFEDGDKMILKIGESIDCDNRNLSKEFGDCYYLEIFPCYHSIKFESVILKQFEYLKHPILKKTGKYSSETLLVTNKQYDEILFFIKKNLRFYEKNDIEMKLKYEELLNENLKLKLSLKNNKKEKKEDNDEEENEENEEENKEEDEEDEEEENEEEDEEEENYEEEDNDKILDEINKVNYKSKNYTNKISELKDNTITSQKIRPKANPKGYKYQMYDAKTLKHLKTFQSFENVRVFFKSQNIKINIKNLKNAFLKRHEHKGYRWNLIDRIQDDIEYKLEKTVAHTDSTMEFIASFNINPDDKQNEDKISIINIYYSQKSIANELKVSAKKMCESIQLNKPVSNLYFKKLGDCNQTWIDAYLKKGNKLPSKPVQLNSKPVEILKLENKQITKFQSMTHLLDFFKDLGYNHSRPLIQKHIKSKTECHGYFIKYS